MSKQHKRLVKIAKRFRHGEYYSKMVKDEKLDITKLSNSELTTLILFEIDLLEDTNAFLMQQAGKTTKNSERIL